MSTIVADTGFISSLFKIGQLNLIKELFEVKYIYVPYAVFKEISECKLFSDFVMLMAPSENKVTEDRWIVVKNVEISTILDENQNLGAGESEAIALAKELGGILLIDDRYAIKIAKKNKVTIMSIDMLLMACKIRGLIDTVKMKTIIKELKEKDKYELKKEIKKELLKGKIK